MAETLFTVVADGQPTAWGEEVTLRLVNPDGSVCTESSWQCGPHGFTMSQEADMAEWVGVQAEEFIDTYFTAAWEQNNPPPV